MSGPGAGAGRVLELLKRSRRPVVATHWDMDGVASAVAVSWILGGEPVGFYIPPFTYRLTGRVLGEVERLAAGADLLVLTDLAYPGRVLDEIQGRVGIPLAVIDHHYQGDPPRRGLVAYYNPASSGDPGGDWPSAAHVIATLAGSEPRDPLLLAVSIAGDLGRAALGNRAYRMYMAMAGLDPVEGYRLARDCSLRVGGAAVMGDREALIRVIEAAVYRGVGACEAVMGDGRLAELAARAEAELEELASTASPAEERAGGRLLVYRLEGEGMHASRLARILAGRSPGRVVVVAYTSRRAGQSRVYARLSGSQEPPLAGAAECLKRLGYSAGGKTQPGNNVAAVEVDPWEVEEALEAVVRVVESLLSGRDPCEHPRDPPP
ncbi:hypothetical protein [Stetteria hydrogenophila]